MYDFLQMPTNAGKSGKAAHSWENSGEDRSTAFSGTLGSPLERHVSLMLVTILISAMGVNRTFLRRLLGGWAFALAFRREASASPYVSHIAATSLPPSRRCRLNGALLDELPLVTGLAPLLETNLRAKPNETLHATDASPSGAGGCFASTTRGGGSGGGGGSLCTIWPRRKGWRFRLDWKGEEPPSNMHDVRAAAAPLALNLLELESLVSLLRRITRAGMKGKRLLALVDSRVVLGCRLKKDGRAHEN